MDAFDALPRVSIGTWPTPVRRLDAASDLLGTEVWAKLEEACGAWGGNKVRKLEYLLAPSAFDEDKPRLVTYGAGSSSWTAAVAVHGRALGFEVTLGLAGAVPAHYERLYRSLGVDVVRLPRLEMEPFAIVLARARVGRAPARVLSLGGSGGLGDVGSARAGAELAVQVASRKIPTPAKVFVACGTAGTAAGLAVGMGMAGLNAPVVAVRVTPRPWGTAWLVRRRVRALTARLHALGHPRRPIAAPVISEGSFLGDGYGRPAPGLEEAVAVGRSDDLDLDRIYAGKAFAALTAAARAGARGPLLLLHTSPGPLDGGGM